MSENEDVGAIHESPRGADTGAGTGAGTDVGADEEEAASPVSGSPSSEAGEEAGGWGYADHDDDGDTDAEEIERARSASRSHLKGLLEALVFVADKPVSLADLVKTTGADRRIVRALLDELAGEYKGRGIHLQEIANGFIFRTSAVYAPFLRDNAAKKPVRMTRAQLETLAIIAYRQPLTRPDIDDIRGVDSGAVLKMLLERDLVRILGKKDEPGRPLLYGTTSQFLEFFGLKSLKDLPTLRELSELTEESRRILEQKLGDALDDEVGAIHESPPGAGTGTGTDADTDTGADAGTDAGADADTGAGTDADADADAGTDEEEREGDESSAG